MPKSRQTNCLKPWIIDTILSSSEPVKANTVKVIKHLSGPDKDGSIIREVTDGSVFIKAVFLKEALDEMFSEDESTQPEWYSALLILKKYTICFDVKNTFERSEFIVKISSASIWDLQQGFYLKYRVTDCMDDQAVIALAMEAYQNYTNINTRNDTMNCSIPLTQLLENMTNTESQVHPNDKNRAEDDRLKLDFVIGEFIISPEQIAQLDNIKEWKTDYVPSFEELSEISPEEISVKERSVEKSPFISSMTTSTQKNEKANTSEITLSGESIKLSCSDNSNDETTPQKQSQKNMAENNEIVVTSSSENSEEKTNSAEESQAKGDNSNKNQEMTVSDGSVSSTVFIAETQPFVPISLSQSFSPKDFDPFMSIGERTGFSCGSPAKKAAEPNASDQSLIDDTPEENLVKKKLNLTSHSIISSAKCKAKESPRKSNKQGSNIVTKELDKVENNRLQSLSRRVVQETDLEEENRLTKLTSSSEESAETLLRRLDKPTSVVNEDNVDGTPPSQKSVSDNTLMEISSGEIQKAIENPLTCQTSSKDTGKEKDIECDNDTQDPTTESERRSSTNLESDSKRRSTNTESESRRRNATLGIKTRSSDLNVASKSSSSKSSKRNRSDCEDSDKKLNKCRKIDIAEKQYCSPISKSSKSSDKKNLQPSIEKKQLRSRNATPSPKKNFEQIEPKKFRFRKPAKEASQVEESLEGENSQSLLNTVIPPLNKPAEEVILISSGDSEECHINHENQDNQIVIHSSSSPNENSSGVSRNKPATNDRNPKTSSNRDRGSEQRVDNSASPGHSRDLDLSQNRQRNLFTQTDSSGGKLSDQSTPSERAGPSRVNQVKGQDINQRKPKNVRFPKLDAFLSENSNITEIGERLLNLTIPDDLVLSAFAYYKERDTG